MSQLMSLRLPDEMVERLDLFARRQGNGLTRTKASMILLEESLRESEFAFIEFRDTFIGRQAFMKGSGLTIWEVVMIARGFEFDAERIAQYYPYPVNSIKAAFQYYEAYRKEIDQDVEDNNIGYEKMKRLLPNARLVEVNGTVATEVTES